MEIIIILAEMYLLLFSIYHIFQGILSVFFSDFAIEFNKKVYGFKPKETEQLKMNLKPWGSLALTMGVIGLIVYFNIETYSLILIGFSLLLFLRISYRMYYHKKIKEYWGVTIYQNIITILIQIIGILLFTILFLNRFHISLI